MFFTKVLKYFPHVEKLFPLFFIDFDVDDRL